MHNFSPTLHTKELFSKAGIKMQVCSACPKTPHPTLAKAKSKQNQKTPKEPIKETKCLPQIVLLKTLTYMRGDLTLANSILDC